MLEGINGLSTSILKAFKLHFRGLSKISYNYWYCIYFSTKQYPGNFLTFTIIISTQTTALNMELASVIVIKYIYPYTIQIYCYQSRTCTYLKNPIVPKASDGRTAGPGPTVASLSCPLRRQPFHIFVSYCFWVTPNLSKLRAYITVLQSLILYNAQIILSQYQVLGVMLLFSSFLFIFLSSMFDLAFRAIVNFAQICF